MTDLPDPELLLLRAEKQLLLKEVRMLSGCLIAAGCFGLPAQIHADLWGPPLPVGVE